MEGLLTLLRRIDKRLEHIEMCQMAANALLSTMSGISPDQQEMLEKMVKDAMGAFYSPETEQKKADEA